MAVGKDLRRSMVFGDMGDLHDPRGTDAEIDQRRPRHHSPGETPGPPSTSPCSVKNLRLMYGLNAPETNTASTRCQGRNLSIHEPDPIYMGFWVPRSGVRIHVGQLVVLTSSPRPGSPHPGPLHKGEGAGVGGEGRPGSTTPPRNPHEFPGFDEEDGRISARLRSRSGPRSASWQRAAEADDDAVAHDRGLPFQHETIPAPSRAR